MADVTKVPNRAAQIFAQWGTPDNPNPRLAAPAGAGATTYLVTAAPLDENGDVVSTDFEMGIRDAVSGYVLGVKVPASGISADGKTLTNCVPGIPLTGLDWTTGDPDLAPAMAQDSPVFFIVSGVDRTITQAGLTGEIGVASKFYQPPTYMDTGIIADRVFATEVARDAVITVPTNAMSVFCLDVGVPQDYYGGLWNIRGNSATPNASEAVAGKVELATNAEMRAGTSIGGTGARLVPPNDQLVSSSSGAADQGKLLTLNAAGQIPAGFVNAPSSSLYTAKGVILVASAANTPATQTVGANNTVLIADSSQANGVRWGVTPLSSSNVRNVLATQANNVANATVQTIAHGLGKTPTEVEFTVTSVLESQKLTGWSYGTYDGTSQNLVFSMVSSNTDDLERGSLANNVIFLERILNGGTNNVRAAVTAVDATNVTITWTTVGGGAGAGANMDILMKVRG